MKNYGRPAASLRRGDSGGVRASDGGDGRGEGGRRRRTGREEVYYNIGDGVEGKCSAGAVLAPLL